LNKINMPTALKNFGQPINSFRDDVALITNDDGYSGYFSSNRENEDGNDNVFYFKDIDPERFFQLYGKKDTTTNLSASLLTLDSIPENIPTIATNLDSSSVPLTASTPVVDKPKVSAPVPLTIPVVIPQDKPIASKPIPKPVVTPFPVDASKLVNKRFTPVYFEFDKYGINQSTMQSADSVAHILKQTKSLKVYITAHTDSRGDFEYNINLSEKRANTVKKYLIQKGVPLNQIISRGLGESELVNECSDDVPCTEDQHAKNRRVELKIVK
jgi:outer membrane protein OmpA-like peptidoglycan-associated protein